MMKQISSSLYVVQLNLWPGVNGLCIITPVCITLCGSYLIEDLPMKALFIYRVTEG